MISTNHTDRFSLRDKVVVVTGGSGLYGRQLTRAVAEAGAAVIVASRNLKSLGEVVKHETASGHVVFCESLDQGDEQSILSLRDRLLERFGRVDGLINNSVLRSMTAWTDPVAAWEDSLKVNGTGVFLMLRTFGKLMADQGEGSIVNIGSMQGMVGPMPELYEGTGMGMPPPDYFFHKGGMINMTRYFASLFGRNNVRVNCISAGGFFNDQPEPFLSRYVTRTMLGRMADEDDLGGVAVFLLSRASRYITGVNLPADGGYTAK